jgi:hypothetical protein
MTAAEWAAGCLMFGGIALVFWAACWAADMLEAWFPERNDNDV